MRVRVLGWLALGNALVAAALALWHPHGSELSRLWSVLHFNLGRDDSSHFMDAACSVAGAGRPVYRELFFGQGFKFLYPPASLLMCGVAPALGVRLVTLINLLALVSVAATLLLNGEIFLLLCPTDKPRERWAVRGLVASLGLLFSPLIFAVYLGQVQAFLELLFVVAVWAWLCGKKWAAGLALAVVCCFKPPLALFLVWGLVRREWRFVGWLAGASAVLQGASLWRFGWGNAADYLRVLSFLSHHGEAIAGNQSVNGSLERWVGNGVGAAWTATSAYPAYNGFVYAGTLAGWGLLLGLALLSKVRDRATDFLVFGLCATVASPIAWTHHYGIFYVGCIFFLAMSLRQRGRVPWWFVVAFLVLANTWPALDALTGTRWNPLVSYDLYAGLVIIGGLGWGLLNRNLESEVTV